MSGQYAVIWYDEDYIVVEWDIIPEGALEEDARLTHNVAYLLDREDRGEFENIDWHGVRGEATHEDAVYIGIAGPFFNAVQAQYYIDADVLAYQDED